MSGHKDSFQDRLKSASAAKKTALAMFKDRPKADDPAVIQQMADRMAVGAAREAREGERRQAKEAEALAKQAADMEAMNRLKSEEEDRIAEAGLKKAARDARYAARKARK